MYLDVIESEIKKPNLPCYVNWKKLTSEQKSSFKSRMSECLANIQIPHHEIFHGSKCCEEDSHKFALERYFLNIVSAVSEAESFLPRSDPNKQRSYWNEELSDLKQQSIECGNNWKRLGCPRTGPAFECWKKCHYTYKAAIRTLKAENEKEFNDSLHHDLTTKNGVAFWKKWYSLNRVGNLLSSRVNGETDDANIANEFASYFESVYSGSDNDVYSSLKEKFSIEYAEYFANHIDDDISPYYVTWSEMVDIAARIKIGKSSSGVLRPEHFLLGAPELLRHLQVLFNGMLQHSFVPTEFVNGVITPIAR